MHRWLQVHHNGNTRKRMTPIVRITRIDPSRREKTRDLKRGGESRHAHEAIRAIRRIRDIRVPLVLISLTRT